MVGLRMSHLPCYTIRMIMKTILISPDLNASKRTKQRIVENGATFTFEKANRTHCLLRSVETNWLGWLPRHEFHVERIDKVNG